MAVKDRLAELRNASAARGVYVDTTEPAAPAPSGPYAEDIEMIFQEAERLLAWLGELAANSRLLQRLHSEPTFHTNKTVQDQLDSVVAQSNALGVRICGALTQLEARARGAGGLGPGARNDARARIARLQYAAARRRARDALADHHRLLQLVRDQQAKLLQQQVKLTNLTISEEECEALLDNKNISLFVDNVKAETAEARLALRAVEARRDELARVEAALRDVRDLFVRLSHLVAEQQEQIDSVTHFALQATDYVESGEQQLLQGVVTHRKANRKKVQLIICVVIGFAVVLLVLIIT